MRDSNLYVEIGNRIHKQRKELHLTQEQLAEMIDVTPQMISTAENGTKGIRPENIIKLSNALNISCDYLLTGKTTSTDIDNIRNLAKKISVKDYQRLIELLCLLKRLSESD